MRPLRQNGTAWSCWTVLIRTAFNTAHPPWEKPITPIWSGANIVERAKVGRCREGVLSLQEWWYVHPMIAGRCDTAWPEAIHQQGNISPTTKPSCPLAVVAPDAVTPVQDDHAMGMVPEPSGL